MSVNRSAVAAVAAVLGVAGWVVVGIGQTASPPARGAQPARALPPTTTQPARGAQGPTTPVVPAGTGSQSRLPLEPLGIRGEAIWPAFEGWGPDKKDGTNLIVIGYNNRNNDMDMDIPIGPNNRMEPGGPDLGQPTHFMTGRKWGVFAIPVPKDFGTKKYTWTLIANGKTSVVQFWMNPPYWVDYYLHGATLNEPPVIWFAQDGPKFTGPPRGAALTLTAKVNEAVPLTLWATDEASKTVFDPNPPARGRGRGRGAAPDAAAGADPGPGAPAGGRGRGAPPILFDPGGAAGGGGRGGGGGFGRGTGPQPDVVVLWTKYRGPGWVSIDDERLELFKKGDPKAVMQATTEAWFFEPGEYWLRAQVNDASGDGGGGDQCCWTNALVKVVVR